MGRQELYEVPQREMQSLAAGEKSLHVLVQAGGQLAGKQLGGKGPEGPGGDKVECEPAMGPGSKGGQQHPGLH